MLDHEKTFELEKQLTKAILEFVSERANENPCQEITAALISALANSLVIIAYGGLAPDDKPETLEAISMGINRAYKQREIMMKNLNIVINGQ